VTGTSPGQNTVSTSVVLTVSSTTVLTLSPSLPPPTVPANGQPVLATYNFSSGNPNWLNGGVCTSEDSNISAQITHYGSSSVGINVAVGAGDHNSSGTIDCTCPGGGGGTIHPPIIISQAPVIWSVTDAAGDQPAVLYAGGTATITITGANFGSVGGLLYFCTAGTNPCVLPGNATPMSYNYTPCLDCSCTACTWTDSQIITTVTLPSTAPTGAWQMFVISLAWVVGGGYTNPSMGNLDVTIPPQVSGPIGVPLNGSASFAVTITPGNMDPVTVTLSTTSGTGSAKFADGTTSQTIYESQDLTVMGKVVSSTANNLTISTSVGGNPFGSAQFSVVSVTISLNATQGTQPASDDSASAQWLPTVFSGGPFGSQISINAGGEKACAVGVELVGTVTPSNYSGTITLQRNFLGRAGYIGSSPAPGVPPPGPDNSNIEFEVTTPTAPGGHVYDLDAPNINANTLVSRARYNFQEYAVLGVPAPPPNNPPQVGPSFAYYARMSCGTDANGNPAINNTVPGDNQAGIGTTLLTWNLQ
jgi:hypothetical protein